MSTATMRAPSYVQTLFHWDEQPAQVVKTLTPTDKSNSRSVGLKVGNELTAHNHTNRSATVTQSSNRIGGCAHVGSPLVKVLNKYGFTLDDLLVEIERQKQAS